MNGPGSAAVRFGRAKGGKDTNRRPYEGIDFDIWDSFVSIFHQRNQLRVDAESASWCGCSKRTTHAYHDKNVCGYFKQRAAKRWVLNFLVAVLTGLVAVGITYLTRLLSGLKFGFVNGLISNERSGTVVDGAAFLSFLGANIVLATASALMVAYIEPVAAGSGISEIKCILNGVKLPRAVRFKTLVVKALGVTLSVASGLPVGKEGPMIHSGAVVAAGLSQGKSRTFGIPTRFTTVPDFRNDAEKRDFISCGAAAGVAAAFNAPVGGTLFSLEEGSSFWSQALTWRAFVCAMVSAYTINLGLSAMDGHWGKLSTLGMFSFGDFTSTGQNQRSYVLLELVAFLAIGALGGLIGAAFNHCNKRLTQWRMEHAYRPWQRVVEVAAVSALMAGVSFFTPAILGRCLVIPEGSAYADLVVPFYCDAGEYNDVATFFFAPAEDAIRMLFHFESDDTANPTFRIVGLVIGFVLYATMTCVTYGIAVPSGLFVPSLLTGSALGRAIGEIINLVAGSTIVDAGTYSLIGAAAMLGGMARMTISLAVILLESTGDLQYGLPLMLTLLAARWAGNAINEGLYDIHIHLHHWPLLEEKPPKGLALQLRVCDVMVKPVKQVCEVVRVGDALDLLRSCSHNGFPVVYSAEALKAYPRFGSFAGFINRKHITTLIVAKAFHTHRPATVEAAMRRMERRAAARGPPPLLPSPIMEQSHRRGGSGDAQSKAAAQPPLGERAASFDSSGDGDGDGDGDDDARGGDDEMPAGAGGEEEGADFGGPVQWERIRMGAYVDTAGSGMTLTVPVEGVDEPPRSLRHGGVGRSVPFVFTSADAARAPSGSGSSSSPSLSAFASAPAPQPSGTAADGRLPDAASPPPGVERAMSDPEAMEAALLAARSASETSINAAHVPSAGSPMETAADTPAGTARAYSAAEEEPVGRGSGRPSRHAHPTAAGARVVSHGRPPRTHQASRLPSLAARTKHQQHERQESSGALSLFSASTPTSPLPTGARQMPSATSLHDRRSFDGRASAAAVVPVRHRRHRTRGSSGTGGGIMPVLDEAGLHGLDIEGKPLLTWSDFEKRYPRYPTVEEAEAAVSEEEKNQWLDLRPFMNATPFTVHARAPLMRAYRLFRTMGLRHLVAVNDAFDTVGILTRTELLESSLALSLKRRLNRERLDRQQHAIHN